MGCCFGSYEYDDDYRGGTDYSHHNRQRQHNQHYVQDESAEEKREKARLAAEKRLAANQTRGTGHPTTLEARQKRLEEQERQAIVSGRANQRGNLTWQAG